jgi:hypothetical protein
VDTELVGGVWEITGKTVKAKKLPTAGLLACAAYHKGPTCKATETTMKVVLYVEASQPCGRVYRLGIGCELPPALVSTVIIVLARLF